MIGLSMLRVYLLNLIAKTTQYLFSLKELYSFIKHSAILKAILRRWGVLSFLKKVDDLFVPVTIFRFGKSQTNNRTQFLSSLYSHCPRLTLKLPFWGPTLVLQLGYSVHVYIQGSLNSYTAVGFRTGTSGNVNIIGFKVQTNLPDTILS